MTMPDYPPDLSADEIAYMEKIRLAHINAANIPGWATWTPQEANQWGQDNIGTPLSNARTQLDALQTLNLATFKIAIGTILDILDSMWTMQQAFGQMLLALRDKNWPNL